MEVGKERYDFLDLLKFIGIYFVILYHFNKMPTNFLIESGFTSYVNYYIKALLSTCVPIFFFVNGALLLNKKLNIKDHINKIIRIIIITGLWGLITLLILMPIRGEYLSYIEIIKGIWDCKQGWINHLWFLQALVVIYIFFPIIKNAYDNNKEIFKFFLTITLILTFGNVLLSICANICEFIIGINHWQGNFNFFNNFNALKGIYGYSIGYFMLGGIFLTQKNKINTENSRKIAIILIVVSTLSLMLYGLIMSKSNEKMYDVVWDGYDTIFTLTNVICVSIIALPYNNVGNIGKYIRIIGENSLGIYFLHIIVGSALSTYFQKSSFSTYLGVNLIFSGIILLISLYICLIIKRIPILKQLVSL